MTKPFKGNFIIERELWNGFKELCQANGTTVTEELTAFIKLAVSQGELDLSPETALPPAVLTLKDAIEAQLTNYIDHVIEIRTEQLNDKLAHFRQGIEQKTTLNTYTDTYDDTDKPDEIKLNPDTYNDTYNNMDEPDKVQPDSDRKKQNTPNEKPTTALEVILGGKDDIEYSDNDEQPPMLTDAKVAKIEKVSTETIRRYRAGQRKPKPDFWQRWRVSPRYSKRWEKIE